MENDWSYRQAVETEYRDIVFRSKSEAILARNFDLLGMFWVYEPPYFMQGDLWVPDFWVVMPKKRKPGFHSMILEFKPKLPTGVYKDRLFGRFLELRKSLPHSALLVFIGDPFNRESERSIEEWTLDGWLKWESASLLSELDEAAKYRFDLKEAA